MNRGYNFGAGPSMLPASILHEVQKELLDWQGCGMSVMEIGHRTPEFMVLMEEAEQGIRDLLAIPENYQVLFLGGAARCQFSMIPMNFLADTEEAGYLITGLWSDIAYEEANKLKKAYPVTNGQANGFTTIPSPQEWQIKAKTRYLYLTPNETVNGLRFNHPLPKISGVPLIADMTSCLLSEPITVSDYGLIFAGAQKNIANAGLTLVIIANELLNSITNAPIPTMFDYQLQCEAKSMYATPPTFNCYLANKMFHWIKERGGVEAFYQVNRKKAALLYDYIDSSNFYHCHIANEARSLVNICFTLNEPKLEESFLNKAKSQGLFALKGHRTVGGLRASMYNAMPIEGVESLIKFMHVFAKEHN